MAAKTRRRPKSAGDPPPAMSPDARRRKAMAATAQRYMDRHAPAGYAIRIVPDAVELRGETWYVVAEPDKSDVPYSDFINRITDASLEMEDGEHVYVLFVPTLPPDGD